MDSSGNKGTDKASIEAKTTALTELSHKFAEKLYAQPAAEGQASPEAEASKGDDQVVDAEFEEVDDKK